MGGVAWIVMCLPSEVAIPGGLSQKSTRDDYDNVIFSSFMYILYITLQEVSIIILIN